MWLTDCDSDFDKFAEFAFKEGFKVEKCPIAFDYWIKNTEDKSEDSIRQIHFGEIVLADRVYAENFWRWERDNNYKDAIANIKWLEEACKKYF